MLHRTRAFTRSSYLGVTNVKDYLSWFSGVQALGGGFLDLAYPPCCLGCNARTVSPPLPICPSCLRTLERASRETVRSQLSRLPVQTLDEALALWVFAKEGVLQRIQHAFKYENRPYYGVALGKLMGEAHRDSSLIRPRWVVPIPLHRVRFLERGYNQSAMLARGVSRALGVPVREDLLLRPEATHKQTTLSREERWTNVHAAFNAPQANDLIDSPVLLIDDILTTGSTATAAAQTLKAAGASTVDLLTLAFAQY